MTPGQRTRAADREGLQVRPGGALVPGLRRLRDPRGCPVVPARARDPAREPRVRLRDRLRRAVPVLPRDVRAALDPRARAGDRDGSRDDAPRPLGLGRDGRRRRALDRRQPPDPRAAPERRRHDPALQQPHLRAHEGPVLADVRAREGDEVDAARVGRPPVQPAVGRDRRRGDVRRARDRHGQAGDARRAARGRLAPGRGVRRDPPELQHLQRRRLRRRPRGEGEPPLPARRRGGALGRQGRPDAASTARSRSSTRPPAACSGTTRAATIPGSPSRSRA